MGDSTEDPPGGAKKEEDSILSEILSALPSDSSSISDNGWRSKSSKPKDTAPRPYSNPTESKEDSKEETLTSFPNTGDRKRKLHRESDLRSALEESSPPTAIETPWISKNSPVRLTPPNGDDENQEMEEKEESKDEDKPVNKNDTSVRGSGTLDWFLDGSSDSDKDEDKCPKVKSNNRKKNSHDDTSNNASSQDRSDKSSEQELPASPPLSNDATLEDSNPVNDTTMDTDSSKSEDLQNQVVDVPSESKNAAELMDAPTIPDSMNEFEEDIPPPKKNTKPPAKKTQPAKPKRKVPVRKSTRNSNSRSQETSSDEEAMEETENEEEIVESPRTRRNPSRSVSSQGSPSPKKPVKRAKSPVTKKSPVKSKRRSPVRRSTRNSISQDESLNDETMEEITDEDIVVSPKTRRKVAGSSSSQPSPKTRKRSKSPAKKKAASPKRRSPVKRSTRNSISQEESSNDESMQEIEEPTSSTLGKRRRRSSNSASSSQPSPKRPRRSSSQTLDDSDIPVVMFTGIADHSKYEKQVKQLKGKIATSVEKCTHLVTDKVRRTVKFLSAIGLHKQIISLDWLDESRKSGVWVDAKKFTISDMAAEKKFKFTLQSTLLSSKSKALFEGYSFFTTASVKPPNEELKQIIESAHGKVRFVFLENYFQCIF